MNFFNQNPIRFEDLISLFKEHEKQKSDVQKKYDISK